MADITLESNPEAIIGYSSVTAAAYQIPNPTDAPSKPKFSRADDYSGHIPWYDPGDNQPVEQEKAWKKNPDLTWALNFKARALFGGGIDYRVIKRSTREEIPQRIPKIDEFIRRNWLFPIEACKHIYHHSNIFAEYRFNADSTHLSAINAIMPKQFRYAPKQKNGAKAGELTKGFISADFENGVSVENKELVTPVEVRDPRYFDILDVLDEDKKPTKFIHPLYIPTGNPYYQDPSWWSVVVAKWFELANSIPTFKIAVMNNQITIKYLILMPDYWMEWKYPEFKTLKPEQQKDLVTKEIKYFDDFLKGAENAGKSITATYKTDPHTKQSYGDWKIIPIDDKMRDGMYIEDSVEATIKIFTAAEVDPAIAGIIPGKGGQNRSGSDRREALNIHLALNTMESSLILKPYQDAALFNRWDNDDQMIQFYFIKPYMQTLDQVTPSKRQTTMPDDI